MKKMLLLLLLAASTFAFSRAQDSSSLHKKHTAPARKSQAKQLNLTKDQQDKIKASKQQLKTKTADINASKTLTDDQKKQQIKDARKKNKQEVSKVYTPEQKAKLKEMKAKRKTGSPQKKQPLPKSSTSAKS